MAKSLGSLARMTLRQLRQVASDLGVGLYSRKSKDQLVAAIGDRNEEEISQPTLQAPNLQAMETEMEPAPRPEAETNVVFLPRDPQWAYVFWEISEDDRASAQSAGATQLCLRVADVTGLPERLRSPPHPAGGDRRQPCHRVVPARTAQRPRLPSGTGLSQGQLRGLDHPRVLLGGPGACPPPQRADPRSVRALLPRQHARHHPGRWVGCGCFPTHRSRGYGAPRAPLPDRNGPVAAHQPRVGGLPRT